MIFFNYYLIIIVNMAIEESSLKNSFKSKKFKNQNFYKMFDANVKYFHALILAYFWNNKLKIFEKKKMV